MRVPILPFLPCPSQSKQSMANMEIVSFVTGKKRCRYDLTYLPTKTNHAISFIHLVPQESHNIQGPKWIMLDNIMWYILIT